jgi:tetratricopeptide (TPR) repeat protein
MSAAPRPQTEEVPPSGDTEGWALLEGLRRRLDEQANQHRKTQTQVTQLADSIAALVTAQRRRSRWLNINSFVAYLIFTMLCGGAFYLLYQSRAREMVGDHNRVINERDTAAHKNKQLTEQIAARDAADAKAWESFQLLETGKREEAAKKLAELTGAPLSKFERMVLDTRAKQAEVMQVDASLKGAANAFKAGRHADVIGPLEVALTLETVGPRAALMHYYLGVAYAKGGALEKAIAHLQSAVEGDVEMEDARFHLASALDRSGLWGKARVEYERFATGHPMSSYTAFATRRAGTLSRSPDVAPAGMLKVQPPGAGAPAPAPGAPTAPATAAPVAAPGTGAPPATGTSAPRTAPASGGAAAPGTGAAPATAPKTAAPRPAYKVAPKAAPKPPAAAPAPAPAPKTLDFNEPE